MLESRANRVIHLLLWIFVIGVCYGSEVSELQGGDAFIQLGDWRIGIYETNAHSHLSFSSVSGQFTSMAFRSNGNIYPGPSTNKGLWDLPLSTYGPSWVSFESNGIVFGPNEWCLGMTGNGHLSVAHQSTSDHPDTDFTVMIWRYDGTRHPAPRDPPTAWSCWSSSFENTITIGPNQDYIEFNNQFRIGDTGLNTKSQSHFSIVSERTCVIYRSDGTVHSGPRDDWSWPDFNYESSAQVEPLKELEGPADQFVDFKKYDNTNVLLMYLVLFALIVALIVANAILCIYCNECKKNKKSVETHLNKSEANDAENDELL